MARMRIALLPLLLALATVHIAQGASPDDWRGRTIYQIITDRFAIGSSTLRSNTAGSLSVESADPALPACAQQETYCGGNFEGIIEHLDYIQNMGFDAIWISPIPENFPNSYHGYGAKNIYEINSHFGGSQGLYNLVQACHERGMYVMVDVVGNHMGIPPNYDWTQLYPFNQSSHFHGCSSCPSNCWINDFTNQNQVEICRLDGLPDLDQSNPFVASTLLNWISSLVSEFGIDGLRIDTVAEVHPTFWDQFQKAAGIYAVGEVFNGDVGYVSSYQQHLDALLSYPLYFAMTSVFGQKNSMSNIANLIPSYSSKFKDINLLGTFIDNHDNPRFLNVNGDTQAYKNALVYTLMSTGIPIVYYGTEQGYSGGDTPHNRLPLWLSGFSTSTDLYKFLSTVIKFRKDNQVWTYPQVQRYADDNFYAFTRGNVFVATTNVGSGGNTQTRTITYHPYQDGTVLCNLFWGNDCVTVASGKFTVSLQNGEVKIYSPSSKH